MITLTDICTGRHQCDPAVFKARMREFLAQPPIPGLVYQQVRRIVTRTPVALDGTDVPAACIDHGYDYALSATAAASAYEAPGYPHQEENKMHHLAGRVALRGVQYSYRHATGNVLMWAARLRGHSDASVRLMHGIDDVLEGRGLCSVAGAVAIMAKETGDLSLFECAVTKATQAARLLQHGDPCHAALSFEAAGNHAVSLARRFNGRDPGRTRQWATYAIACLDAFFAYYDSRSGHTRISDHQLAHAIRHRTEAQDILVGRAVPQPVLLSEVLDDCY